MFCISCLPSESIIPTFVCINLGTNVCSGIIQPIYEVVMSCIHLQRVQKITT